MDDDKLRSAYDLNAIHRHTRRRHETDSIMVVEINGRFFDRITGEPVNPYDIENASDSWGLHSAYDLNESKLTRSGYRRSRFYICDGRT